MSPELTKKDIMYVSVHIYLQNTIASRRFIWEITYCELIIFLKTIKTTEKFSYYTHLVLRIPVLVSIILYVRNFNSWRTSFNVY